MLAGRAPLRINCTGQGPDGGAVSASARGPRRSARNRADGLRADRTDTGPARAALSRRSRWPLCLSADGRSRSVADRSEEHTSELQSLMRISYAVFCLKTKKTKKRKINKTNE